MTCCAAVSGSFVGVRRFLAAFHHEETPLSRWEGEGEGGSVGGMDCERAGDTRLGVAVEMFNIARTFSSIRRRSSASWVRMRSASRRERSRSRSASRSSSSSVGRPEETALPTLLTKEPTRWAKLDAKREMEGFGDCGRRPHVASGSSPLSSSEPSELSISPVFGSTLKLERSGEGDLGRG
ncbi:hypothetical protein BGY98DRAFT_1004598 [Russula aff. rugulosa BPL654]|nr:hypothetical protein BGY98DRAFT_1004598 [Russula aff. rugulosa BPL654]